MNIYIARQPIFDRKKKSLGYELLFRSGEDNSFKDIDGTIATYRVIHSFLLSIGIKNVVGDKSAFINFNRELLLKGLPEVLEPTQTVIEILEDVKVDDRLVETCRDLVKKGYRLALDDFSFTKNMEPLLPHAEIVKLDVQLHDLPTIEDCVKKLSPYKIKLLAEKIETEEEFQASLNMGFHYFQGYFFSKPQMLSRKDIPSERWNKLNVLKVLQQPGMDIDKLEKIICRDPALSFRLLRYINSTSMGMRIKISSIRQASVLLGQKRLTRWLSLIILGEIGAGKPRELFSLSTIRAKFCELIATELENDEWVPQLFTVGMFSLLDAIMDRPLNEILSELTLEPNLNDAMLEKKGPFAPYLILAESYEKGTWQEIIAYSNKLNLSLQALSDCYLEAIQWADTFMLSI